MNLFFSFYFAVLVFDSITLFQGSIFSKGPEKALYPVPLVPDDKVALIR